MIERKIYIDIPGGKKSFHSAILTSFSFDFYHFENQVLRALKSKWITSINVLVDQRMLDKSLGISYSNIKSFNKSYAVSGVNSTGAFHPKINLFVGENKILLIFGSGNITVGGHGKNHEIFTGFFADSENQSQLPLIVEACNYLLKISSDIDEYSKKRIVDILLSDTSLYKNSDIIKHDFYTINEEIDVCLLYNDETSIFNQISSKIGNETITKITVISPFYDDNGITLNDLSVEFPNAILEVFLQKDYGLHPYKMAENSKINFYEWNETERGKKKLSGNTNFFRKLHSKIFIFENKDTRYCLLGSANATRYGLGCINSFPINQEFGVFYKSNKIDFLEEFGVVGEKIPILISDMLKTQSLPGDSNPNPSYKVLSAIIRSAEIIDRKFRIDFRLKDFKFGYNIALYNNRGELCVKYPISDNVNDIFEIRIEKDIIELNPVYCTIINPENENVSHKETIKFINNLNNTNPSSTNRSLSRIFYSSSDGSFNDFEIIELLNDQNETDTVKKKTSSSSKSMSEEKKDEDLHGMSYKEALELDKKSSSYQKIVTLGTVSRILEIMENVFEEQSQKILDENIDEEEEADAEKGRERKDNDSNNDNVDVKSVNKSEKILGSIRKMFENYFKSINTISKKTEYELDILDLENMILLSLLANRVCYFTDYTLTEDINPIEWQKKLDNIFKNKILESLKEFSKLCVRFGFKEYQEEDDNKQRQEKNIIRAFNLIIFNLSIIYKDNNEPHIENEILLIGLNVLSRFGNLPTHFEDIEKPFRKYVINRNQIIRFKEELILSAKSQNQEFLYHPVHGACKHLSFENNQIKIKSVYGINTIPKKAFKHFDIQ